MSDKELFIANAIMRQALMAIEEVMGEPGLKAVLRASGLEKYIDNPPPCSDFLITASAPDKIRVPFQISMLPRMKFCHLTCLLTRASRLGM